MRKIINNHPEYTFVIGIRIPIPNKISNIPVRKIISVFKGIKEGIIIVIPFEYAKCPIAVKKSIAPIPILADKKSS